MDVKILFMPNYIYDTLMIIGLLYVSNFVVWLIQNLLSLYYHKESYKNPKELRYFLILEENKKLKQKIESLEEENSQIVSSIISKLN
jgi:hypothetical protein